MRRALPLLLTAALVVEAPAHAAEPSSPTTRPATSAAELVRDGDRARRAGRCAEAVTAYQAALAAQHAAALSPDQRAAIVGELGVCEVMLGKFRDAAEHLQEALEQQHGREQQRRFEEAQKKAEREVGMVFISVDPPDAEVLVDGRAVGTSQPSYLVFVEPGRHAVRARLKGYADAVTSVPVNKGEWPSVWLQLPKAIESPTPRASRDASRPPQRPAITEVADNRATTLRKVGVGTAAALAVLGTGSLVTGAALNGEVKRLSSDLQRRGDVWACRRDAFKDDCAELHGMATARDVLGYVGVGSLLLGGVIGGVTLSSLVWAPGEPSAKDRPRARLEVMPSINPSHAGAQLTGSW